MNERIKELLEQTGVKYVTMPKDTVYEKFAELIVRECVDQCFTEGDAERIAQHFGIDISEEE